MPPDRVILHCDCNGFFASVECLDNPALKDVPMAVAGDPKNRSGIILAKNEIAKGFGVLTTQTIWQARQKCPHLVLVPPRHHRYTQISRRVNAIYLTYTDQVEPFGIDESFLDVTGSLALFGSSPRALADEIRARVRREIGITISVGVSFNKIFAKLGSDMKKPDATTVITRENFRDLVWPLPAGDLLFVGKNAAKILEKHEIHTIGDLARYPADQLTRLLGKLGDTLHAYANGLDAEPVRRASEREALKSVGNGMTLRRDLTSWAEIKTGVLALSDEVAARMREAGVKCRTVHVAIKNPELKTITRQATLVNPTHLQKELVESALSLIRANWPVSDAGACAPIRALTVTGSQLVPEGEAHEQTSLFDARDEGGSALRREKYEKIEAALASIREKHGAGSIALGYVDNEDLGIRRLGYTGGESDDSDS